MNLCQCLILSEYRSEINSGFQLIFNDLWIDKMICEIFYFIEFSNLFWFESHSTQATFTLTTLMVERFKPNLQLFIPSLNSDQKPCTHTQYPNLTPIVLGITALDNIHRNWRRTKLHRFRQNYNMQNCVGKLYIFIKWIVAANIWAAQYFVSFYINAVIPMTIGVTF